MTAGLLGDLVRALGTTLLDAAPVVVVVFVFQTLVLRRRPPHLRRVLVGVAHVVLGLALFRVGLQWALLPIGADLSDRLTAPALVGGEQGGALRFFWLHAFAALLGFATVMVEPALTAIAGRVGELTGGSVRPLALRVVVATGVAAGLVLGTARIVAGVDLAWSAAGLVGMVVVLVGLAPRQMVPLAFDCGAFATSVVTVPVLAAFAVGLAAVLPGRDPLTDGFGIILFALLAPVASVLAYTAALARGRPGLGGGRDGVQASARSGRG